MRGEDAVLVHPEEAESEAGGQAAGLSQPVADFLSDIGAVPAITEEKVVRRRSRDFFWFSPILNEELTGRCAEAIVRPRCEAEVIVVAAAAYRHHVPLTPRGGGTGNYGQSVPLAGGVLLDMTELTGVSTKQQGTVCAAAGTRLIDVDEATRQGGWELRMHPSTKRSATLGGFVAGGSGGIGSVTYGQLREPGNVLAARVVTVEAAPRVLELAGAEALAINRAYGTTGLMTQVTMPLAPAHRWIDLIAAFPSLNAALEGAQALAFADGIAKKLLSPMAWPLPATFGPLKAHCPEGQSILIAMVAAPGVPAAKELLARHGGSVTYEADSDEGPGATPLYEYTWNHTTLQWLKGDRSVTYLQALYPHDRLLPSVRQMAEAFGDELVTHLEFIRFGGRMTASGIPIIRCTSKERIEEIIAAHEAAGISIANPHVVTLEDGSRHKRADGDQLGFKRAADPRGLLNPGKMRSFVPEASA